MTTLDREKQFSQLSQCIQNIKNCESTEAITRLITEYLTLLKGLDSLFWGVDEVLDKLRKQWVKSGYVTPFEKYLLLKKGWVLKEYFLDIDSPTDSDEYYGDEG